MHPANGFNIPRCRGKQSTLTAIPEVLEIPKFLESNKDFAATSEGSVL
jgi:hypothetical protein